jgi:hypothetical protein
VRPGYYRVDVSGAPKASGTVPLIVAFTNLSDATVAIVVGRGAVGDDLRRQAVTRHGIRRAAEGAAISVARRAEPFSSDSGTLGV